LRRIALIDDKQKSDLLKAASDIANRAYAPYSKINRGAAILTASGAVFTGCNVEIASYGGSLCAEMSAVSAAVAAEQRKFIAIALSPTDY
ncbi:cytidine deaminase, partial [Acinetobacter baumannii]